jgi:phosphopantothenoylcysteine decarboxylase / phosphopantothenate---cysteine ligase
VKKRILLIVSGGIAAVKCPDLIHRLSAMNIATRCILTSSGAEFVTPLSLAAFSGDKVYNELFCLTDESQMGHIELSRRADLILVVPATAHILARMASGLADDLATTVLLATDKPVMVAPAMNVQMWEHAATAHNLDTLKQRGIMVIGPEEGEMACGEYGFGRMSEPEDIVCAIKKYFSKGNRLRNKRALVTSGPTIEAIDPARYIASRSSGKQGHAIANALAHLGAKTTLVSGPSNEPDPSGVSVVHVQSARDMLIACKDSLPADIVVCAAAVSDWRTKKESQSKLKKNGVDQKVLDLILNPDILATMSKASKERPSLVVGFAAETEDVIACATKKRITKGCDWIVANDISTKTDTFGGENNTVNLITPDGVENWPKMSKPQVAEKLALRIADALDQSAKG